MRETEIRHLYKPEPLRRGWEHHEQGLLRLNRKLTLEERMQVYVFAERLVMARIKARLERRRLASRKARHG